MHWSPVWVCVLILVVAVSVAIVIEAWRGHPDSKDDTDE